MTDHAPLPLVRRAHVLAALAKHSVVRVSQLTDELGISSVTLRRDLTQMEDDGLLVRVHGGAVRPPGHVEAETEAIADPMGSSAGGGSIAVLVPSLSYYWPSVIRGMETEAQRRGIRIRLRAASYELQDERPLLERLVSTDDVRGLIVAPNADSPHTEDVLRWLEASELPTVLVEREVLASSRLEPVESVTTDHALGALLAARHLAALGHRRVGLVLSRNSPTARKIAAGWEAACAELTLAPSQHFEQFFPPRTSPDFSAAVGAVLETIVATGVTGLLVHSDPDAMALIDLALNRGLSVPGDLSVVAYDDEVASLFTPPLTAVRPPRESVGAAAVDLVMRRLQDPTRPIHRVTLNPVLNVRLSTSAATEGA